jgi:hypothetical protein
MTIEAMRTAMDFIVFLLADDFASSLSVDSKKVMRP